MTGAMTRVAQESLSHILALLPTPHLQASLKALLFLAPRTRQGQETTGTQAQASGGLGPGHPGETQTLPPSSPLLLPRPVGTPSGGPLPRLRRPPPPLGLPPVEGEGREGPFPPSPSSPLLPTPLAEGSLPPPKWWPTLPLAPPASFWG